MPVDNLIIHDGTQNGKSASLGDTYYDAAGEASIGFATGQYIWLRFPQTIPKGATISLAVIDARGGVKSGSTTQSSYHRIRAVASGNAPKLIEGAVTPTSLTTRYTDFTASYTANQNTQWVTSVDITVIIQEIVDRADYQPGGYITLAIQCTNENGSDMNWGTLGSFDPQAYVSVTYTENYTGTKWHVNQIQNSSFGTDTSAWGHNDALGTLNMTGASLTRDTSFKRTASQVASLRLNMPAPSGTKETGMNTTGTGAINRYQVFCGWIYIPSTVNATVYAEFLFLSGQTRTVITTRNAWVPFCTTPYNWATDTQRVRWPFIGIGQGYQQGQNIWISEPTLLYSPVPQYPFNAYTADGTYFDYQTRESNAFGQVVRQYNPRKYARNSSGMVPAESYKLEPSGLWSVATNIKI